ncbi:hypothetical protein [Streptomyces atratus]|uniref:hypothetical protein n=1 Tax=Streptomyces atratus TaxID=1893 RepID=UPI00224D55F6|nr:hypothetical protein [Streptomyces atratus]MCX5343466.1 hypothetical protein [Streptomyces atratus]
MSGNAPVDPVGIPVFTGDLALLDTKVTALSGSGAKIATAAGDVHTSFGGLSAFYKAPEAEQLFATTKPVADTGLTLSSDLCVIAGALGTYSDDAYPLVEKLKELKREAVAFRVKVDGDDKWREDGDLVEENNHRRNEIAEVWAAFQEVERACHAKIVALVGGKALKTNDGSTKEGMYGYDAEALKQAKSLPWGDAVEESTPWWQVWEHAYDFGKGFVVDGVWGTIKGLGTLFGVDGWDAAKQAWTGLAKLATGVAIAIIPGVNAAFWALPDDKLPSWIRDSRTAMKETGKALVAWDQWGNNPSRAAGAVTFNVLTTVFTGGTGGAVAGAGKAGMAAKALSFAGKTGRVVDPMTYVFKGAGAGISKIGDVMAGLKGLGKFEAPSINMDGAIALPEGAVHLPDGAIHLPSGSAVPDGAIKLPDGNIKLPEGTTTLPPGTVKLPVDGPSQFMDPKGNIYDADGAITQRAKDAPTGKPDAGADIPRVDAPKVDSPATAKVPERELVGVGGRGGDAIRLGSDISDPVHVGDHTPGARPDTTSGGHAGHGPSNDLNAPRGGHGDTPSTGSHTDTPSTVGHTDGPGGTGHTDGPSTGGGRHEPPPAGGHHPDGPGGTGAGRHEPPASAAPDEATRAAHRAEYEAAREVPPKQRTPEESMAITREHVRLANEDPVWRAEHYDKWGPGYRNDADGLVDGQLLPKLIEKDGSWIATSELPHADPGSFHLEDLVRGRDTVDPEGLTHLDEVSAKRRAGMDLNTWEKAFGKNPSFENAWELAHAQEHYNQTVGEGVSNNTKLGEALGEEAARRHMLLQEEFKGAKEVDDPPLPETPNGSRRFDQLWRDKDGNLVIVEAKSPNGTLDWRQGAGKFDRFMVKQGTIEYVRTIMAEMADRGALSPGDAKYAAEIRTAIKNKTLRYVLVQAAENTGTYAGAELKHFKLF